MSVSLPPPQPEQLEILRTTPADLIAYPFLLQCCYAYGHWQIACGTPVEQLQTPEAFVTEADLERFVDVVSRWPNSAPTATLRKPDLFGMVHGLRTPIGIQQRTFAEQLDWHVAAITRWMEHNKIDPAHPNETKEERKARQNREGVRRHRQRNAVAKSSDPEEQRLTEQVRALARSVQDGRSWAKRAEAEAKRVRDAAIEAAKAQCVSTISAAKAAVANEEHRLNLAQGELDAYTSNN